MASIFQRLPLVKMWIGKIDEDIGNSSFTEAMRNLLKRHGARVKFVGKDAKMISLLKESPVLVVSNHPNEVDVPLMLASLEPRDDVYMVSVSSMSGISPNLDKHLIPVYVNHRMKDKKRTRITNKVFRKIHFDYDMTLDEAHQKNIESIERTSKILDNKGLVAIFPEGSDDLKSWQPGVGYIIKGLKYPDVTSVIYVYIENTSAWHILGIIPLVSKLIPAYKVYLSKPASAGKWPGENAKVITRLMELDYKKWVENIKQSTSHRQN